MYNFDFVKVNSVEEALKELAVDESLLISGGQTLIPTLKQRLASPERLISIGRLPELIGVSLINEKKLSIGSATTHHQVAEEVKNYYGLSELASKIGDPAVRYRGTIGGSIANNDPSACYPAAVLASRASIITNVRVISADDFFTGIFATALEEKEIIKEVIFNVPKVSSYVKFDQPASRFALVGVFLARFDDGVKVAVTGASEGGVFCWTEAEDRLSEEFEEKTINSIDLSSEGMIADVHGSPKYRAGLVKTMLRRALLNCK